MKSVEVTMTFKVPTFYTFDDTAGLVAKIMEPVKKIVKESALGSSLASDADVVSVVVDEDDDEE